MVEKVERKDAKGEQLDDEADVRRETQRDRETERQREPLPTTSVASSRKESGLGVGDSQHASSAFRTPQRRSGRVRRRERKKIASYLYRTFILTEEETRHQGLPRVNRSNHKISQKESLLLLRCFFCELRSVRFVKAASCSRAPARDEKHGEIRNPEDGCGGVGSIKPPRGCTNSDLLFRCLRDEECN